jgi:hypothetical protein
LGRSRAVAARGAAWPERPTTQIIFYTAKVGTWDEQGGCGMQACEKIYTK